MFYKEYFVDNKLTLEKSKGQSRMDNPEKLVTSGTQDTGQSKQNK